MKRLPLLSLLALVFVAPFLGSCGGGESPGGPDPQPSSTPTPANSVRSILIPNFGFVLAPDVASFQNIDFPPVGNIDVTIDWGGGSQVNLYVAESSCASFTDIRQGRCSVLARDDSPSKPKVVRFNSVAGRVYSIWVHNSGAARETVSGLVGITTAGPLPSP